VTTGPNTRVEVSVLGRLDMFLKTREPSSCFAGAPTSVWHRSRLSQFFSQRFPETRRQSDSRKTPGSRQDFWGYLHRSNRASAGTNKTCEQLLRSHGVFPSSYVARVINCP